MKQVFTAIVLFCLLVFAPAVSAQGLATCDVCGYCEGSPQPSNWESCRDCMYPGAVTNQDTRRLNPNPAPGQDVIPTPAPGRFYLSLAKVCVKTGGFGQPNSAGAVAQTLLNIIFGIAGGIAFLYILFGAFQVATSQNNPEKINYGKRLILGAIVGLIISLSAVFLVNLIGGQILKIPGFG